MLSTARHTGLEEGIELGLERGIERGHEEGTITGAIQSLQQILGDTVSSTSQLKRHMGLLKETRTESTSRRLDDPVRLWFDGRKCSIYPTHHVESIAVYISADTTVRC